MWRNGVTAVTSLALSLSKLAYGQQCLGAYWRRCLISLMWRSGMYLVAHANVAHGLSPANGGLLSANVWRAVMAMWPANVAYAVVILTSPQTPWRDVANRGINVSTGYNAAVRRNFFVS